MRCRSKHTVQRRENRRPRQRQFVLDCGLLQVRAGNVPAAGIPPDAASSPVQLPQRLQHQAGHLRPRREVLQGNQSPLSNPRALRLCIHAFLCAVVIIL